MDKRFLILLFFSVFFISLVSATATIGQEYNITVSCNGWDCSNLNITVLNPNSSAFVSDAETVDFGDYASYQLTPLTNGEYFYYLYDGANYSSGSFVATPSGLQLDVQKSILYIGFFSLLVFLFMLVGIGITKLPSGNQREGEYVSISMLKYLRSSLFVIGWGILVMILYVSSALASAYLESGISQILFMLFRLSTIFSVAFVILYFLWLFASIFDDRKIKKLMDRGVLSKI